MPDQETTTFLNELDERLKIIESSMTSLKTIESSLNILHNNVGFFERIATTLEPRLAMIETAITVSLPAQIQNQDHLDKANVVTEASMMTTTAIRLEVKELQKTIDDFRRDAVANWVSKADLKVELATTKPGDQDPSAPTKTKLPTPAPFTGERADWKSFLSHLTVYFTANSAQYAKDSDKILFAISRLGSGSAFKFMEPYILDFAKPLPQRPMMISDYATFVKTMSDSFGVQNTHVVAETALRALHQKGSALDYTTKFNELAADTTWNDSAKISQYRVGLKDAVSDALALLDEEPLLFADFAAKAIQLDARQYARYLDKSKTSNTHRHPPPVPVKPSFSAPSPASYNSSYRPGPSNPRQPVSTTSSNDMDLSAASAHQITADERNRRISTNACIYCGEIGHWKVDCPRKDKQSQAVLSSMTLSPIGPDSYTFELGGAPY
jgi:hypothetical protein